MFRLEFDHGFDYAVRGALLNSALWFGFYGLPKRPSPISWDIVPLSGLLVGAAYGATLPNAHLIRKPLQSLKVNRDIQDLAHLVVQLALPFFFTMGLFSMVGKVLPDKISCKNLTPYLICDIALFSFELLSAYRWKDIKGMIIPGLKKI